MVLTHRPHLEFEGLIYPLMVIAAVAVILFSLLGIASVSGWLPTALMSSESVPITSTRAPLADDATQGPAFGCAECGVIQSLRSNEKSSD